MIPHGLSDVIIVLIALVGGAAMGVECVLAMWERESIAYRLTIQELTDDLTAERLHHKYGGK